MWALFVIILSNHASYQPQWCLNRLPHSPPLDSLKKCNSFWGGILRNDCLSSTHLAISCIHKTHIVCSCKVLNFTSYFIWIVHRYAFSTTLMVFKYGLLRVGAGPTTLINQMQHGHENTVNQITVVFVNLTYTETMYRMCFIRLKSRPLFVLLLLSLAVLSIPSCLLSGWCFDQRFLGI